LWLGMPHADTWPQLHDYFGTTSQEELRRKLGDDFRWICPSFFEGFYRHPRGRRVFDLGREKKSHGQAGPLAEAVTVNDVERYEWPNLDYLDFEPCLAALRAAGDFYRASGLWTCFFHDLSDLFGLEEYLVKMYTHPEVVEAATDRVCGFYYEANRRFFEAAGGEVDGFFFGNDLGTQRSLICRPEHFDRFLLPWIRRFVGLAHAHGVQAILHSCGAVHEIIGRLIEAGVDGLHPLQARASGMSAEELARDFGGRLAFIGGIDTQELLVHGTPAEVAADVRRVRALLGPRLVVSPSHEAVLPNVPPANIEALARAALER